MDPKKMQLEITGFLEGKSKTFMEEFWTLLVDAQNQPSGIPSLFIEKKKAELVHKKDRESRFSNKRKFDSDNP
jgi:serine/arginine repetitive matrix protein 1